MVQPRNIIDFWFYEDMRKAWFQSTPEIDGLISSRYEQVWQEASEGQYDDWRKTAEGCLALNIVLDQFPLNMFRREAKSFSTESMAVDVALHAVENSFHLELPREQVAFLIMPLMHSENMEHQDLSVALFTDLNLQENARFARHHRGIVEKFGRFPHRNEALERESTAEELAWLESDEAFRG